MKNSQGATAAFITVTTLFFAWGFITSNNDPLIAALRAIFSLNYTEALMTQFAFFMAYGFISLPAAALLNRRGPVQTILLALGAMIAACFIIQAATVLKQYSIVLLGLFVIAGGITTLQVAANPLAANLGSPERSHFRLTLAQAFNSLGVVLGVHFGSQIMLGGDVFKTGNAHITEPAAIAEAFAAINHAFFMIALLIAVLAIFIWWSRKRIEGAIAASSNISGGSAIEALRSPWALFGALAIFLYVGAEVSIGSVMINFLNQQDILALPLDQAGSYLANIYWGGALVGRFLGSMILMRIKAEKLLLAAAGIATALCLTVFLGSGQVAGFAALSVGLFNAIMFPIIFTLTLQRAPIAQSSTSGLLCLAIVGGAFLPVLMGVIADNASLTVAFIVPVAAYGVITLFAHMAGKARIYDASAEEGQTVVAH